MMQRLPTVNEVANLEGAITIRGSATKNANSKKNPPSPSSTANAVRDCADGIGSELLTVSDRDLAPLLADAPAEVRMPDTLSLVPLKVSFKKDAACSPTFPSPRSPPPLLPPSYEFQSE